MAFPPFRWAIMATAEIAAAQAITLESFRWLIERTPRRYRCQESGSAISCAGPCEALEAPWWRPMGRAPAGRDSITMRPAAEWLREPTDLRQRSSPELIRNMPVGVAEMELANAPKACSSAA